MNLGDAVGYIRLDIQDFLTKCRTISQKMVELRNSMNTVADNVRASASSFAETYDVAGKETEAFEKEISKLGSVASSVATVAAKAFAAIGAAAMTGIGAAIAVGSNFEASMSQVAATMGMTAEEIQSGSESYEELRKAAEEAGATTKFTATQAGEALNYLALAGYSAEQSISALPTVLDLAAAGGMGLASASDMITDAASALGLAIDDMSYFADQMARTAQKSNTSVAQLGDAILQIGGTAKGLAGGVTELDTALGILANNGIKAAEGGTALRQIILNLTAPTDKAAAYMKELGLEVSDAAGNIRPLNDIFRDLDEILQSKGITGTADVTKALSQIFDARQLKSANALLANYGDTWDKLYGQIDNAEGAASNMAKTMSTNLQGAITTFKSALEGVGITIYDSFETKLTAGVQAATKQLSLLNQALKSTEMQEAITKLSVALGNVIANLADFAGNAIPKLLSGFAFLVDNLSNIAAILAGVATAFAIAKAGALLYQIQTNATTAALVAQKIAQLAANAAMLANPYTIVAVAVGALVAGIIALVNKQKELAAEADAANEVYYQEADAINALATSWEEAKQSADELRHSNDEQITDLNTMYALVKDNTNAIGTITSCYNDVIDVINTLNELLPVDLSVQDGQIVGYGQLAGAVEEYNKQLEAQAELEARRSEYEAALASKAEAEQYFESVSKELSDLSDQYMQAEAEYQKYSTGFYQYSKETQEAAKEQGVSVEYFVNTMLKGQRDAAKNALDIVTESYVTSQNQVSAMEDVIKKFKKDYPDLMFAAGQEVEGLWKTHDEAMRAINQQYAEDMAELNRQIAQGNIDAIAESAEEQAEKWTEAQTELSDLERRYNIGEIASEEEYYRQRLEILNKYNLQLNEDWAKAFKQTSDKISDLETKALEEEEKKLKEQEEARQKAIEDAKKKEEEQLKAKEEAFKKEVQLLEDKLYLDESYTEEMYWNDLRALTDTLDKSSDLWEEYDRKIRRGIKDLEDEKKQAAQQAIEEENKAYYEGLQTRKKYDDEYTDTQYLADLQAFIQGLDKESDMYKTVADEILSTQKSIADNNQKIADDAFQSWESGFNALISEASSAYSEIESKQKNLENTLNSSIDMYELKTKQVRNAQTGLFEEVEYKDYTSAALQKQIKSLDNYEAKLEALKKRGVSEELMSQILSLSPEEGEEFVASLTKMSDAQLKAYDSSYTELLAKNKAFSEKYYSDSVEEFKTEWGQKITDYINSLPEEAKVAAKELVDNFIQSLDEQSLESSGGLLYILNTASDAFKDLTKSGEFENYGTTAITDFSTGMTQASTKLDAQSSLIGSTAGQALFNAFKVGSEPILTWAQNMWDKVNTIFSKKFSVTADIAAATSIPIVTTTAVPTTQTNTQQATETQKTQSCNCLTKQDVVDAIKQTQPKGNVVLTCDGKVIGQIALKELNNIASNTGKLQLNV